MMPKHTRPTRDAGLTMIEMLVTMAIMGLVAVVIGAAGTVIFRNQDGVADVVGESHDVQQAVNYFHLDVESGPPRVDEYFFDGDGCGVGVNLNVLRFDTDPDGDTSDADRTDDRRIAYRLVNTGASATLDRIECSWSGGSWATNSVRNIADSLDTSGGPPVSITVVPSADPTYVERIEMTFAQDTRDRDVSASPRAESGTLDRPGVGGCAGNPLAAAIGFGAFVEGDMYLDNGFVDGSLAVGGQFGWSGVGRTIGAGDFNNTNGFPKVTLHADSVDWAHAPTAGPVVASNTSSKNVVVGGTYFVQQGVPDKIFETNAAVDPHIEANKNSTVYDSSLYPIDYSVQFGELQDCADALAALPYGADANHTQLTYSDGDTDIELTASGGAAMVLNIPEANLSTIDTITIGSPLSNTKPLIINISEDPNDADDDIVFDLATPSWTAFGDYKRVIYNFVNLEGTVTVVQPVYGTIYSTYASVVTNDDVHGAVVASSWVHNGGQVENDTLKLFNATINWTP